VSADALAQIKFPPRAIAWRSALIIFVLTAIAMADRMSIAMLIGPIKKDFGIGDFQASLLVGAAFTSFYVLFLIPIGFAADRFSRRKVLAICLFVWSLATIACGWVEGFAALFLMRMLVGAGEAGLAPSVHGIIGDSFPRAAMAKPLALQGIGFQVGSALGVAAAGAVLAAGAADRFAGFPIIGEMPAWRIAFILIGIPGLAALLLIPLLHDPKEGAATNAPTTPQAPLLPFLRENATLILLMLLASGFSAMGLGAVTAWVPEYLQRVQGIAPMKTGAMLGALLLLAAFGGQGIYAIIVDWFAERGVRDATIRVGIFPLAASIIVAWLTFGSETGGNFFLWMAILLICIAPCNAISNTLVQQIAPPALRSRLAAMSIFAISVIGFTGGPALVGGLSQYVFGEAHLGTALHVVIAGAMALSLLLLLLARQHFVAYLERQDAARSESKLR
jgi:MFS family permease